MGRMRVDGDYPRLHTFNFFRVFRKFTGKLFRQWDANK